MVRLHGRAGTDTSAYLIAGSRVLSPGAVCWCLLPFRVLGHRYRDGSISSRMGKHRDKPRALRGTSKPWVVRQQIRESKPSTPPHSASTSSVCNEPRSMPAAQEVPSPNLLSEPERAPFIISSSHFSVLNRACSFFSASLLSAFLRTSSRSSVAARILSPAFIKSSAWLARSFC